MPCRVFVPVLWCFALALLGAKPNKVIRKVVLGARTPHGRAVVTRVTKREAKSVLALIFESDLIAFSECGNGAPSVQMPGAVVSRATGSFTDKGERETLYGVAVDECSEVGLFNPETYRLVVVRSGKLIANIRVEGLPETTFDLDEDGVREVLTGYSRSEMGYGRYFRHLVSLRGGALSSIEDFGEVFRSPCGRRGGGVEPDEAIHSVVTAVVKPGQALSFERSRKVTRCRGSRQRGPLYHESCNEQDFDREKCRDACLKGNSFACAHMCTDESDPVSCQPGCRNGDATACRTACTMDASFCNPICRRGKLYACEEADESSRQLGRNVAAKKRLPKLMAACQKNRDKIRRLRRQGQWAARRRDVVGANAAVQKLKQLEPSWSRTLDQLTETIEVLTGNQGKRYMMLMRQVKGRCST